MLPLWIGAHAAMLAASIAAAIVRSGGSERSGVYRDEGKTGRRQVLFTCVESDRERDKRERMDSRCLKNFIAGERVIRWVIEEGATQ